MPEAALSIRDLVVQYGSRRAVAGLSLTAPAGAVTALVGPNGAGKTSTVEACVGLRTPGAGEIRLLGTVMPPGGTAPAGIRQRVGVMLQDGGLYPTARPLELVAHVASMYPRPRDPAETLDAVGIDPTMRTPIRRLSGGEQQRVKCAAALVGSPELVFLDEPTAGLDATGRRSLHDLVRALVAEGTSVVLTTHLMDDVERLADHVVVIARGRDIARGPLADLVGDDDSVWFGGPPHADLTALRAALPPGSAVTEGPAGHYRVTGTADPQVLAVVAAWCGQLGIRTSDMTVGRRSLEDVVMRLVEEAS